MEHDIVHLQERIKTLESRLDQALQQAQNMRKHADKAAAERAQLRIAQDQARQRIESMIAQLKSLEQHT